MGKGTFIRLSYFIPRPSWPNHPAVPINPAYLVPIITTTITTAAAFSLLSPLPLHSTPLHSTPLSSYATSVS
ncbi:hypothetical protein E2C01_058943 [Portunus trituberculatus]|uniref:Uncharacterized protein n=1 Tax=Portunus trituberculatus TaxID=210409 RepID=A0A5B7GWV8_PORTR|nr:hypothetical protein [Portunus trituberculatus]